MTYLCTSCKSPRTLKIYGKTSDCFMMKTESREYNGYPPIGIFSIDGDSISLCFCQDCGKVQGTFPVNFDELCGDGNG